MSNIKFFSDLAKANETEKEVLQILLERNPGITHYKFGKMWKWDIALKNATGHVTYFEVKEDFKCEVTGNVAVEIECYGKASGLYKTEADFFIFVVHKNGEKYFVKLYTDELLKATKKMEAKKGVVIGGDSGSYTNLVLFKWEEFINIPYAEIMEVKSE